MNAYNDFCLKISSNQIKKWNLILFAVVFNLLLSLLFSFISHSVLNKTISEGFKNNLGSSLREQAIWIIIVGPFFETLLYQYAIIETANKKLTPFISCIISAFLFGLSHTYNVLYFVFAFITGFIFSTIYYIGSITKRGIFYTFLAHSIYNGIAFILNAVFNS
ncbi:CPBP family intramembrane metalloprotease [Flavobacterium sp. ALJ2]|uniref:CPBP family intramembrane glutamic endopeptidase n=1 Tax=Flavobacterium sp. ALJ2 TaxID=2786960 RepID=UPI00189EF70C|nr:CPBP family intramembrane glutamic endopeptidase [Flavobacterium sp. ALJ2]MBF7092722.1 CPBP family intramembrane metalloprotease [Flavobacterium sp. ALJ2]